MKFHQLFIAAILEPKKLAAFRLLPIGKVIRYVFYFILFMTLLSISRYSLDDYSIFDASMELQEYIETIGWLIYPVAFILQLIISTFYIFFRITFFATLGFYLLKVNKRRGEYRHIWRTSAFAITVPLIVSICLDLFSLFPNQIIWITSTIHLLYIVFALYYYPKVKK